MSTSILGRCGLLCRLFKQPLRRTGTRNFFAGAILKTEWTYREGKFNSISVFFKKDVTLENNLQERFKDFMNQMKAEHCNLKAILCFIPMCHCSIFQDLINLGFIVHHAKTEYMTMTKWLVENQQNKIPPFSNHQVGVSGFVFDEVNMKAIVVQDKGKTARWKFPGGFSDPGENIRDTCVREVREETGIISEFRSVLTFRQQHERTFGQSDLYFICRLHPLSFTITKCEEEIAKCEWMSLEELLDDKVATSLTQLVTRLILKGVRQGFHSVDLISSNMTSWVPPYEPYQVYHRPVDTQND